MLDFNPSADTQDASNQQTKNGQGEDTKSDRQTEAESTSADENHCERKFSLLVTKNSGGKNRKQSSPVEEGPGSA